MVILQFQLQRNPRRLEIGALTTDLLVAISILLTVMIPLGLTVINQQKLLRTDYYRAVVIEILDGEMDVLRAGEWKSFKQGTQTYEVKAEASKNLPPGNFALTLQPNSVRLDWIPENPKLARPITRTISISSKPQP